MSESSRKLLHNTPLPSHPTPAHYFCPLFCNDLWALDGVTIDVCLWLRNRPLCHSNSHLFSGASLVVMSWGWQQQWSTGTNTHLEDSLTGMSHSPRKIIEVASQNIGTYGFPSHGFCPGLGYQTWTPFCGTDLRSNWKAIDFTHNSPATSRHVLPRMLVFQHTVHTHTGMLVTVLHQYGPFWHYESPSARRWGFPVQSQFHFFMSCSHSIYMQHLQQ